MCIRDRVYTMLHAGGKFGSSVYKVSGGLHGVGASVVNALSTRMVVEVKRGGLIYTDTYENGGHPVTKLVNGLIPVSYTHLPFLLQASFDSHYSAYSCLPED